MEFESKPLDWWMSNLHLMSHEIWLWIPSNTDSLSPDTICYAVDDNVDLTTEEFDQRDADLEKSGLKCFFFKDQLEDIEDNLKAQKNNYDQADLYLALNYYWNNDAFIDVGKA